MAGTPGTAVDPLIRRLAEAPESFDFYQAVRLLECAFPDAPLVGRADHAKEEQIRLCQEVFLKFAPSTLSRFEPPRGDRKARLYVHFFGLLGPDGPMPLHFTEYVEERKRRYRDRTLAEFLDLFHHRMLCLFYRAWADSRPAVSYDRPGEDRFSTYIGSTFGLSGETLRGRDTVPDEDKFHFAGLLASPSRHAEGLVAVLSTFFHLPVTIEQCVGQWAAIPEESACRLGASPETGRLGQSVVVGSRIYDIQQKFRVRLGPLDFKTYERFLPAAEGYEKLRDWIRLYVGGQLSWELKVVLRAKDVPATQLGRHGRLGWTTWIRSESRPMENDAEDLILRHETL